MSGRPAFRSMIYLASTLIGLKKTPSNRWKSRQEAFTFNTISRVVVFVELFASDAIGNDVKERQRRYLIFTPSTQYGVFVTVSVPLPEPDNLINMAWFYEANYYNVDNSTWFEPLLGDIETKRSRQKRVLKHDKEIITRTLLYTLIETMLEKHGYPGRPCLLRCICETSTSHFSHNGLLGDLIHLILTPSSSLEEEDLKDWYYEAEYHGLDDRCWRYSKNCNLSLIDNVSMFIDHLL